MRPKTPPIVRLVGARVDKLSIAYRGPVDVAGILAWGGIDVEGEGYHVDRQRARARPLGLAGPGIDVAASEDRVIVDLRAPYLATHTPVEACAMAERVARTLCPGQRIDGGRVEAIDLCADVAGVKFKEGDLGAFSTRLRGTGTFGTRGHRTAGDPVVTSISLGSETAILVVIYNKSAELRQKHATARAAMEGEIWTARGWDGMSDVWRVEIKIRGRVLTEYGLRDPVMLAERIDGVWQAMVTKTVRLVDLSTATRRERCDPDPRWPVLQKATFVRPAALPAVRNLEPVAGATLASSLGSMMSTLRAAGVNRADAESLLAPIVARVGTPDDIEALRGRIDRAWRWAGRQAPRSVGPGPRKAGSRGARKRAA